MKLLILFVGNYYILIFVIFIFGMYCYFIVVVMLVVVKRGIFKICIF